MKYNNNEFGKMKCTTFHNAKIIFTNFINVKV